MNIIGEVWGIIDTSLICDDITGPVQNVPGSYFALFHAQVETVNQLEHFWLLCLWNNYLKRTPSLKDIWS